MKLSSIFCVTVFVTIIIGQGQRTYGQEEGHSDVEFSYVENRIELEFGPEGMVFEGQFPTQGVDQQFTAEPGFASELDEGLGIAPNDQIVYNVLGGLAYWNDSFKPVPGNARIRVVNMPPSPAVPDTIVSLTSSVQSGSFAPPINRIGEADGLGDFHSDLQWFLEPISAPAETPPSLFGAYGIKMSLSTSAASIEDSDPFFIVYNLGLEEATFEQAVADFAAIVPEPSGLALIGLGAVIVAWGYLTTHATHPFHPGEGWPLGHWSV